ncbi:MAG: nuclear transport factor 2 family protein [Thermomicrobiales bacterium]
MVAGRMRGKAARDQAVLTAIERFNAAFNAQDIEATMAMMTDDCVFENTSPAPDGTRCVGQEAVRREFSAFFANSSSATFEVEEQFAAGDRCVVRWTYRWIDDCGVPGHVRGVDVFRIRDGKVAEKLSYIKG